MNYSDNQHKWVAIVNPKVPFARLINAIVHLALGQQAHRTHDSANFFHGYEGNDGRLVSTISHWPVIVLKADNGNQLRKLRTAALAAEIPCQAFLDTMLGSSAEDQMLRTKSTDDANAEYFAVLLFGSADQLQPLTKKFSLFSPPATDCCESRPFHYLDPH